MSGELIPVDQDLPVSNIPEATLVKLSARSYLPYVKLVGTSSAEAKDVNLIGKFIFCRDKDSYVSLTESFEALVLAGRPRACRKTNAGLESYYDMDSEGYKQVEADSTVTDSQAWHGTEYLIWVRNNRSFATYHASSETARGRSSELTTILTTWSQARAAAKAAKAAGTAVPAVQNPQVTFRSGITQYANGKKQWAPAFGPATTPFSEVPTWAEIVEQSTKFLSPPKTSKEEVTPGVGTTASRG